jgi:dihydropteroate synthase
MHNRENADYKNFVQDLLRDLRESVDMALKAGIKDDKIILDPGVGFAKTYEQNLLAIKHMGRLREIGYPILLGTSRKSVIGLTLDLPREERIEGTLATTILGVREGVSFVRVHDVKENVRAILMAEKILNAR